ncbi:DUF4350 domain-containing protein [Nocardioides bizhenqiangii]|uniref:DUF4350 domain-containing protein n=1 Tax=Nocardioides bizhenqiangii TaxID=3095076 RepID=A0ABZ0ZU28_9ACTN|nr:DUF4350 domain-containing protein [Nocardioides sp. HM61]WQQ27426.1 DUF4350 domain-containing protein [Nocardioides sp. HM61]
MTTTRTAPPPAPPLAAGDGPVRAGFLRRNRIWLVVGVALVLALVVSVWATQGDQRYSDPLDPQNPDPDGAQALAQVLGDEGVDVTIVRSADELHDADIDSRTTVLVTGTEQLAESTTRRLRRDAAGAEVVLADPPDYVVEVLQQDVRSAYADDETSGDCGDERFDDLRLEVDSAASYDTADGCFPSNDGFVLATGADATTYFGAGEALTNDQVLRGDNAAVALRLLGGHDRLVWYLPSYEDAADDETSSVWTFAPDWVLPSLWLVLFSALALMWWRGRRIGKLATEPLPVVVRAVETTRSRGRMYRRADDRPYAAAALRAAGRRRLADHLRLGRGASETEVIGAVARHLGRREEEIGALLAAHAPVPGSDSGLVQLAQELTQLDREVRRG